MEAFDPFDIVVVPFPFTDRQAAKRRPALVLSGEAFHVGSGHLILAMITTATHSSWPGDVALADWRPAGLPCPSVVRAKIFTLDARFVLRRAGALTRADQRRVAGSLQTVLRSVLLVPDE